MVVLLQNLVNFIPSMYLVLSHLHASSIEEIEPLDLLIDDDGKIVLKKLNSVIEAHLENDIINFINHNLGGDIELMFELNPIFNFDLRYFNDVLNKDNLSLSIHFDSEMKEFLEKNKIKPSDYVDEFLRCLSNKENLISLKLPNLNLTEIPEEIYEFRNLKVLNFEDNKLKDCKLASECLQNLKSLYISYNECITRIDDSILNLSALENFYANDCSITEIPESMINLTKLTDLVINKNPITHIAKNFSNFQGLKWAFVSHCKFEEFVIDLSENIQIELVGLDYNPHLKRLKIFMPKISEIMCYFSIENCPSVEIEIYPNLKNVCSTTFNHKDKELNDFEYVIKLNPNELFNFNSSLTASDYKIFNYHIDASFGKRKIISISQFNFENQKNIITKDELIAKWNSICMKSNLNCMERKHGTNFLKSLYKIQNNTYSSYENISIPEYKVKMIIILSSLFDRLEADNLVFEVVDMMEMFERSQPEQLIYFNYLLNSSKIHSHDSRSFLRFIKKSFEILRDYALTVCLNMEENKKIRILKDLINNCHLNSLENPISNARTDNKLFNKFLQISNSAQIRFNSCFTVNNIAEIIYNVIEKMYKMKLFNDGIYNFLLEKCEIGIEFFDYETQANVEIVKRVSIQGIKTLIESIECLERFIE